MTQRFETEWWSIELPDGWRKEGGQGLATFSTDGNDALQISAARKEEGAVTDEDLRGFAGEHIQGRIAKPESCAQFVGFSVTFLKDGLSVKEWWLRAGSLTVFVTYGVPEGGDPRMDEVERILDSLKAS